MIKKKIGFIIFIISIIIGILFLIKLPRTIGMIFSGLNSYTIGYITVSIIIFIASILLFKLGLKWMKTGKEEIEIINQISKKQ
ncbi:hypothetical protein H9I45_01940 [Polaribacter haliotis]|uniref:Uncharacterized protein n=1 Tax=Polaribacter haliotis TaxID=1888915 RepID=A0A7L8AGU0_9FLAO|nr:hypothetical protein [Polaribacter haliotis]QOD61233.1 hypothetical protein H9I45_01940 [Polaribacter haliotis]